MTAGRTGSRWPLGARPEDDRTSAALALVLDVLEQDKPAAMARLQTEFSDTPVELALFVIEVAKVAATLALELQEVDPALPARDLLRGVIAAGKATR